MNKNPFFILSVFLILVLFCACDKDNGECQCEEGYLGRDVCGFVIGMGNTVYFTDSMPAPYNTYYDTLGGIYPYAGMPAICCYNLLDTTYKICGQREMPQIEICTLTPNP
jgi:hypothetical protein